MPGLTSIAQKSRSGGRGAARRPAGPAASIAAPRAHLTRRLGWLVRWTVAWTLFQWWGVIGWPAGLGAVGNTLLATAVLAGVGLVVWRDVRSAPARRAAVPVPAPVPASRAAEEPPPREELAA